MLVRPSRREVRESGRRRPGVKYKTFAAPNGGLVLSESLAAQSPGSAVVLKNGFPTNRGVRIRKGSNTYATIGSFAVESMFAYKFGSTPKRFACGGGGIFDITVIADPEVAPTASVTGQTSNYYSSAMFGTTGGSYLYAVNGTDEAQLYDGTTWDQINASSSPISITGKDTSTFSQVFSYRSRLYFVEGGTLSFWYLPVSAAGGAATEFSLASVMKKGGELLFGARWSQDAGDGMDDKLVLVTDQGEVAIYEGSNPSDANDFVLVGRYEISPPLGKNAFTSAGGDLIVMTQDGMVPISGAISKERSTLSQDAISLPIEPLWKEAVNQRSLPWEIIEIPKLNMGVVSLPTTGNLPPECLVVNLQTSRWGIYDGWDTRCLMTFEGVGYFGTNDGKVIEMETGGSDNGAPYLFQCALAFDHLDTPGLQKTAKMGRATFLATSMLRPQVSVSVNYTNVFPAAPNAGADIGQESAWDTGLWDTAIWDGGLARSATTLWSSVGNTGYSVSPQVQATIANSVAPDAELLSIDVSYITGGLHV